jgi:hypothetical protein
MRSRVLVVLILSLIGFSGFSAEIEKKEVLATAESAPSSKKKKKTTDVSFEEVLVQGKYHFSDEAVTTVEEDKVLDALLGVRTDFSDRIKKSVKRY